MREWVSKFFEAYDYLSGRYRCYRSEGKELQAGLELRREVFGDELKRWAKNKKYCPALPDEFDPQSLHLICKDEQTGQIVGSLRVTKASVLCDSSDHLRGYRLNLFPAALFSKIVVASRLAVSYPYRKSPVALLLASAAYAHALDSLQAVISVIVCEPNLYPMYRKLGYRPLARVRASPFGGYRLPLFLLLHDYDHLRRMGSPFWKLAKQRGFPFSHTGFDWFHSLASKLKCLEPGFSLLTDAGAETYHSLITDGLSKEGKNKLLDNAVRIRCHYGDTVIAKGEGGKNIGFIIKGALEVKNEEGVVIVLGEGDIFGEIAFILNIPRTADLIAAAPETEVVLLSLSAIHRLKKPKDQTQIWKNLAKIVSRRLVTKMNN